MIESVTCSELGAASPHFALLNSIRSRKRAIIRQHEFLNSSTRSRCKRDYAMHAHDDLRHLSGLVAQLDKTSPIDHTTLKEVRNVFGKYGSSAEHLSSIFGLSLSDRKASVGEPWLAHALKEMKIGCQKARVSEHEWRVKEEISQRSVDGWFIVFNTLTVNPQHYDAVFSKGSLCWRDYIRDVERAVGTHLFGSVRKADHGRKLSPFHSYFAVVERGGVHGRLHIHVVHCFRDIPVRWQRDPNCGRGVPKYRQIDAMRGFWRYGFSTPIACRFSDRDAFGRLGWRWPVEMKGTSFVPLMSKAPVALAVYVVKYLQKSYDSEKGGFQWRTRISRGYGLQRMRRAITLLTARGLLSGLVIETPWMEVKGERVPHRRMRIEMLRNLFYRLRNNRRWNIRNGWSPSMILKSFLDITPRPPIVERLRSLRKMIPGSSLPNIGVTVQERWNATGVFECLSVFDSVLVKVGERFNGQFGGACHV